ncbi:MAG: tRNA (adenosine(37)-N6)-threonylcarbamoyltransferase complex ATPase subunit type 1 TsaE [bacterium]
MSISSIVTRAPADTRDLAGRLIRDLPGDVVFALYGGLGSGKTCFVQGLALALGISRVVTSPTFTLIREYVEGQRPLFHFDLYRLRDAQEAIDIGFEDYLKCGGVVAIEWAERAEEILPVSVVRVRFEPMADPDGRLVHIEQR